MKKRLSALIMVFKNLSMQKKMIYAFSIPVIIICILINLVCYHVISRNYEQRLRYSVNQSCEQAGAFVLNYIENMYYTSALISNNNKVEDILSSSEFDVPDRKVDEQYREFWRLNDIFQAIALSNPSFRIGLYVPDSLIYSSNNYYFYPESTLKKRKDYEELIRKVTKEKVYFSLIDETVPYNPNLQETNIALFKAINILNDQGKEKDYICKVDIPVTELEKVLQKSKNTQSGLVYILDADGNLLVSSDENSVKEMYAAGALPHAQVNSWSQWKVNGIDYYVIWQSIDESYWQMFYMIPISKFHQQSSFIWLIILLIVVVISIAVIIISFLLSRYYVGRLANLNQKMKTLKSGDFNAGFLMQPELPGDEIDEIFINFNYMTEEVRRLMREHYRLGKSVMSAELKALQAQINPHFLYNTLDLINWGAMDYGAQQIAEIAQNLGQFYRLSLNHGKNAILIENELKHVEAYVMIENVHFDGAIHLKTEVPEEIRIKACLSIILQPFVENAILHGIAEHPEIKECNIEICAEIKDQDIIFHIKDDGYGMTKEQAELILDSGSSNGSNGYGVKNINFRIKLCYGDKYGITYDSIPGMGTTAYIRIPCMEYGELEDILK